jgi:hypothetical protein
MENIIKVSHPSAWKDRNFDDTIFAFCFIIMLEVNNRSWKHLLSTHNDTTLATTLATACQLHKHH